MKTGVIDVGGGMRGIYAAGVLDTCLLQNVEFDYCIGISAGSAMQRQPQPAGTTVRICHSLK